MLLSQIIMWPRETTGAGVTHAYTYAAVQARLTVAAAVDAFCNKAAISIN